MKSKNKSKIPVNVPVIKPRNPIVLPPNKKHEDKRKKDKYPKKFIDRCIDIY